MIQLYGIPNCDSVKKARTWLQAQSIIFEWTDFKKSPPTREQLQQWDQQFGWEKLLNKTSATWRAFDKPIQQSVIDATSACAIMHNAPTLIKRPILCRDGHILTAGFNADVWYKLLCEQ